MICHFSLSPNFFGVVHNPAYLSSHKKGHSTLFQMLQTDSSFLKGSIQSINIFTTLLHILTSNRADSPSSHFCFSKISHSPRCVFYMYVFLTVCAYILNCVPFQVNFRITLPNSICRSQKKRKSSDIDYSKISLETQLDYLLTQYESHFYGSDSYHSLHCNNLLKSPSQFFFFNSVCSSEMGRDLL